MVKEGGYMSFSTKNLLDIRIVPGRAYTKWAQTIEGQLLVEIRPNIRSENPSVPITEWRLVIDCSGSMREMSESDQESKLDLVKKAFHFQHHGQASCSYDQSHDLRQGTCAASCLCS